MSIELTLLSRLAFHGQEITSPRLRGLVALLAGDLRAGCGTAWLVERLWPDEQPENPTKALQVLVSRARGQLGSELIARTPTGYRLTLDEEQVDSSAALLRASESAAAARAGNPARALARAEAGLALWDGAGGDIGLDDPLSELRAARASTRQSLVRTRALALARSGRRDEAHEVLAELAAGRPRDEEVLLELLRCEAATVGPSEALARYDTYRRALRDELGTDPGPALQAVHRELLRGEAPVVRRGVPHEPNLLLGRANDLAAVTEMLRSSRVTSIVGPGGIGKTRLAYAVCRQAEQRVVHVAGLASVTSPDDVPSEVASAVGVGESVHATVRRFGAATDLVRSIVDALGPEPALLVLDNCEHVLAGVVALVHSLVSTARDVRVLTTSRAPLGLSSEAVYLLPELDLATTVELFEQRARAARPGVDLPGDVVEELCRQLDGLPLAAELAAARVRVMSVPEIARRLEDRFALLRGGLRDAPARHHTLHAVVDWSWNLLDASGQEAMRALSVYPDGFTADAASYLLDDGSSTHTSTRDVLPTLEHLVEQSLLKVVDTATGSRFRMLETVREFGAAKRDAAGETELVTVRFLSWARALGAAHHDSTFGADAFATSWQVRAEQDNLVLALRWGLARTDGATVAAATALLGGLWMVESNYARLSSLADTVWMLSHYRPAPESLEVTRTAATLNVMGMFMLRGPTSGRELVTLRRLPPAPPDTPARTAATVLAAIPELLTTDPGLLDEWCASDQPLLAGMANAVDTYVREHRGDPDGAAKAAERMLEASCGQGGPWMDVIAHTRIGELALQAGRGDQADHHLRAALRLLEGKQWPDVFKIRWALVLANLQRGAVDEAERWAEKTVLSEVIDVAAAETFDFGVRAELRLARGDVDAGLHEWRLAVDALGREHDLGFRVEAVGLYPWDLQVRAAAVAAHAQHGRLSLVEDVAAELPGILVAILTSPAASPPVFFVDLPVYGTVLLAVGLADLERGRLAGDERAVRAGARMIALAERFEYLREFAVTLSADRVRQAAERADRAAYVAAVSSYAALGRDELGAAALSTLQGRTPPR